MATAVALSDTILEWPLEGERLPAPTLKGILASAPFVWLQFLRHLGCIYCKGLVQDIRTFLHSWGKEPRPSLIFIHPNTLSEGTAFFEQVYPEAPHIADPNLKLYRAFHVRRANLLAQLTPTNLWRFWHLTRRGLTNDKPTADPLVLHASFLFYHEKLIWKSYAKHLGDVPNWPQTL